MFPITLHGKYLNHLNICFKYKLPQCEFPPLSLKAVPEGVLLHLVAKHSQPIWD